MGKMRNRPILPKSYTTIGNMLDAMVNIKASCRQCGQTFKVNLPNIIATKGRDYSLLGRHPICRIYACQGKCHFLVSEGKNTPMITLDRWLND
tara:strand:+ start:30688 stop:30966 length:279 start_codon:yes stop_codon:yes gene_type:complete